ncbi:hypothetical protein TNCV_2048601 [Trichonephila clavipes]|nr:hypothetical protein TNCV_2048601 [Trichonephila clavipes]
MDVQNITSPNILFKNHSTFLNPALKIPTADGVTSSSRSCVRRLCGNNHHTCKDTGATLNYCIVSSSIAHRPSTSRVTFPATGRMQPEMQKRHS